jgi:hypothetical protein
LFLIHIVVSLIPLGSATIIGRTVRGRYSMRVVIYAGYNNGLGDLNFGRKMAEIVKLQYPDAEIALVTSSTQQLSHKSTGVQDVENFNKTSPFYATPIDRAMQSTRKGDILIVGPVLTMEADAVISLAAKKDTPIMLSQEYDFNASWQMEDLIAGLQERRFTNIVPLPTGLGDGKAGIFMNKKDAAFDKSDPDQINTVFREGLPITGSVILGKADPLIYHASTNVTISYSHNNVVRFLSIHKEVVTPDKDSDLIIMGETNNKDKMIAVLNEKPSPLDKGFSKIIYHRVGEEPQILGKADNGGPVYRIVHTGRVSADEAINLRKIGGAFSGATGDQSYSEAIATSNIIVYECQSWKRDLVYGMEAIANRIDSTGQLAIAINLLANASKPDEYKELSAFLVREDVKTKFALFQKEVLATKDLSKTFGDALAKMVKQIPESMNVSAKGERVGRVKEIILNKLDLVVRSFRSGK